MPNKAAGPSRALWPLPPPPFDTMHLRSVEMGGCFTHFFPVASRGGHVYLAAVRQREKRKGRKVLGLQRMCYLSLSGGVGLILKRRTKKKIYEAMRIPGSRGSDQIGSIARDNVGEIVYRVYINCRLCTASAMRCMYNTLGAPAMCRSNTVVVWNLIYRSPVVLLVCM